MIKWQSMKYIVNLFQISPCKEHDLLCSSKSQNLPFAFNTLFGIQYENTQYSYANSFNTKLGLYCYMEI